MGSNGSGIPITPRIRHMKPEIIQSVFLAFSIIIFPNSHNFQIKYDLTDFKNNNQKLYESYKIICWLALGYYPHELPIVQLNDVRSVPRARINYDQ